MTAIDENIPFKVEMDASEVAIAAALNQADVLLPSFQGLYRDLNSNIPLSRKRLRLLLNLFIIGNITCWDSISF